MPVQWPTIRNYQQSDFSFPDKLEHSIIAALDRFTDLIGRKGAILSDYRAFTAGNPNSRHGKGDAVDVAFTGADPVAILQAAENSGLFDGIGIYLNERGAVSFHFDKRGTRARWGALIAPVTDPDTGVVSRVNSYTTLDAVLDKVKALASAGVEVVTETVKKKPILVVIGLALIILLLSRKQ